MSRAGASGVTAVQPPRELSAAERLFYGATVELVAPATLEDLRDVLVTCAETRRRVVPAGLGEHAYLGNLTADVDTPPLVVSLCRLDSILRYEPADFTVGVQAGVPVETLLAALAENAQALPVDVSRRGTMGGAVASGLDGPRRSRHGTLRNAIIGVAGMRSDGRAYKAGGMVVKNVAGYDIGKTLVGSLGTLGLLTEVNLKLRPRPQGQASGALAVSTAQAAWRLAFSIRDHCLEPAALSVLCPGATASLAATHGLELGGWSVVWLFEGNSGELRALSDSAKALLGDEERGRASELEPGASSAVHEWLRDVAEPSDPTLEDVAIVRLSVVPTGAPALCESLVALCNERGAACSVVADAAAGVVHARLGGDTATLLACIDDTRSLLRRCASSGRLVFASPAVRRSSEFLLVRDPNATLARRIQQTFDPPGILNAGRVTGSD